MTQPDDLADQVVDLPLAVDLDETLVRTDLLWESILVLLRRNLLTAFLIPLWVVRGKAQLKHEVSRRAPPDVSTLPYNEELLAFLRQERSRGRRLVLATAADASLAARIADHLGIFERVFASRGGLNLKGAHKARILETEFGHKGYDYMGNGRSDLEVWARARSAFLVDPTPRLLRRAREVTRVNRVFHARRRSLGVLLRAIRIKHWVKNLLVLVPVFTAHRYGDLGLQTSALAAFGAFSLVASSVYVLNDLVDLENDRHHHEKRHRPFASGELSVAQGAAIALLLLIGGMVLALNLPIGFRSILITYWLLNLLYSLYLKRIVLMDVVLLALLYGTRVVAGGAATGIVISQWLVAFSVFIFLSLALAKRVSELRVIGENRSERSPGRGYLIGDLEQLASLGTSSGYIAVLVFALYINSPEVRILYAVPDALWLACPLLLYWTSRLWLLAHRGLLAEDPIVWVVRDRVSHMVGLAVASVMLLAAR